jgi:guanylate kinase
MNNPSRLLIVSGPAGSGKTTVCDALLEKTPAIERVVTATTRPPRGTEQNGIDYHFLTPEAFEDKIVAGEFYEHAIVHGRRYGTLKSAVQNKIRKGIDLLLNIDVQGAASFRETAQKDSLLTGRVATVFIMPPSLEELEKRLRGRATDSANEVLRRLEVAKNEMLEAKAYDHILKSTTREADLLALKAIYETAKNSPA